MKISVSQTGKGKIFTYGFKDVEITLAQLTEIANKNAISGPTYKNGHRKGTNVIRGSNIILIDCDEPGQAEAAEHRLQHYDYVKVPSASNLKHPYKWHFIVPTQEPLSIYPAAFKWQIEQFFQQVGITDEMIDVTGSYDIVRQFAPASISMTKEEADALSEVNDVDLQVPVIEAPEELKNAAAKSVSISVEGKTVEELPTGHLWYEGKGITYADTVKAVSSAETGVIVSGFGCPHNNKHTLDNKRGYGFGYKTDTGEIVIKCTGNACKEDPYFNVPILPTQDPETELKPLIVNPVDPELYRSTMESHWINNLGQIKATGMDYNWRLFASTMNNIISANQDGLKSTAHIVPMATGESKTQGSIVYLSILPTGNKAMMVTRLNDEALQVVEQINRLGGNAVAYNSTVDISIAEAAEHQTVVVSHEFFKRNGYKNNEKWQTLADDRDLFIIDEALHSVNSITMSRRELDFLRYTAKALKQEKTLAIIEDHIEVIDKLKTEPTNGFIQLNKLDQARPYSKELIADVCGYLPLEQMKMITRENVTKVNSGMIDGFIQKLKATPMTDAISCRSRYIKQQHLESFYRKEDIKLAEGLQTIIGTGVFATKKRESITGVKELMPGGVSFAVLDATAPINAIYTLQHQYRGDTTTVPVSRTRNYKGFTIKCGRTVTGKSSLDRDSIGQMCNSILEELVPGDKILFVTHKANKVFISAWKETSAIPEDTEIAIEHYGNITGKNNWRDYNKVALIGLPHKGTEFYQSLNIVKTNEDLAYRDEGKVNHTQIEYTDLASDMVQAAARIRVRNIVDTNGGCLPATAYITLNPRKSLYNTLEYSLMQQFPGADIVDWELPEVITKAEQLPMGFEPTLEYLEDRLTIVGADIAVYEPKDVLDIKRESYRTLMTDKTFVEQIKHMGIEIQSRRVMTTRGKLKKRPEKFFVRTAKDVSDWD